LVESLFAYDVVGFQTDEWLETFHDYVIHQMNGSIGEDGRITVGGRTIRAIACPIGIDSEEFIASASGPRAMETHARMVESSIGRSLIVGVARALFEEMLSRCTHAGLLSEDIDPVTGELWGNYPQTYSLVGLINCAVLLSKPWSAIR
jgi:hypothetical protein